MLLPFIPILADLPQPAQDVGTCLNSMALACGNIASKNASAAWDTAWTTFISGSQPSAIYTALVNIARALAICTFMYFLVVFLRDWIEDNAGIPPMPQLIWVLVVIIFMNNNGAYLRTTSVVLRDTINKFNNQVIAVVDLSNGIESQLAELADYPSLNGNMHSARDSCIGISSNTALEECLTTAKKQIDEQIQQYRQRYPLSRWAAQLSRTAENLFQNIASSPTEVALSPTLFAIRPLTNAGQSMVVQGWLAAFQGAFQYFIEISLLLTAMVAPISLGVTLLPVGAKAIFLWLTGMLSLGLCKLSLNIITAIAATALYQSGPFDNNTNMLVLGLLAPVLALAISVGGGMAIFNSLAATARAVVSTATVGIVNFGR
jgi:hypothetical protein